MRCAVRILLLLCSPGPLLPASADALSFQFDYSFDSTGFFAAPERRDALEHAGSELAAWLADDLAALAPGGTNTWTARFTDPSSGAPASVANLAVGADSLVVFVGAMDLGATGLGLAGPGTASVTGTRDWFDTVSHRGETGAAADPASDFGPWGGYVAFDLDTDWHFDITLDGLDPGEADFYSVAIHELLHVMGFGLSDSWMDPISIGRFTGENAVDAFGGPVPLSADREHWAEGTLGLVDGSVQEALMTPFLATGERTHLTDLDLAGLEDVGWVVVPEPGTLTSLLLGLSQLALWRRRAERKPPRSNELPLTAGPHSSVATSNPCLRRLSIPAGRSIRDRPPKPLPQSDVADFVLQH